ncbi:MAG: ArnT family glycosyltransferase [Tepidisphaerales bacterium]
MTTHSFPMTPANHPEGFRWANARTTAVFILAVLVLRILYLVFLCPMQLAGDEAYYWEWSRHLDLCYYEKGPGLAWLIAASTQLFGVSEATIRLPMALLAALSAWIVARLATAAADGDQRAGFFAAVLFCLTPAFAANAQICTQDGPVIACWIGLSAAALRLVRHWHDGGTTLADWLLAGLLLGIGFLFKQSILLFVPSFVIYALLRRRSLCWRTGQFLQIAAAGVLFLGLISPILIWNHQHHWPTLAHTLGHLGVPGGDQAEPTGHYWKAPLRFASVAGAQVAAIGPGALALIIVACLWLRKNRSSSPACFWLICASVPSIVFFLALSFVKPVIGSWPFPSFTPLVALAGVLAAEELPRYRMLRLAWLALPQRPRPKAGRFFRHPETPFKTAWDLAIGYGVIACVVVSFPTLLGHLPVVGKPFRDRVLVRITGHGQAAAEMAAAIRSATRPGESAPIPVCRYYMSAALRAFYLPTRPRVYNAGVQVGKRPTAYDFWPDTDLAGPELLGRNLLLDGHADAPWEQVLAFDEIQVIDNGKFYLGINYHGLHPVRQTLTRGPGD